MKIYLLKKEEEKENFFFRLKKDILLPSGNYLEKFTVKAAGVRQREFYINMQIESKPSSLNRVVPQICLHKLIEYLFIVNQNMF